MDKICLYVQDLNEANYHYLIKKHEKMVLKDLIIQIILCRMSIKILESTARIKNVKYLLIVFDDTIADMINNKKVYQRLT